MRTSPRTSNYPFFQLTLGFAVLLAGAVSGCSSSGDKSPEPAEIPLGDSKPVDTPEEELFAEAKRYYATELYSVARESFKSLAASYSLGAYAEFAEIKAADSYFSMNEFETARAMYEEFLKSRPASRALPYVMMRAGRSCHLSHRGIGRDPQALEKALEFYDRLIAQYPASVYADSARAYRLEVVRDLQSSEQVVADFYARRENTNAAAAREKLIETKWSPLLNTAAAPTGITAARYVPEMAPAVPPPAPAPAAAADTPAESPLPPGAHIVRAVCKDGPPAQVFLYLDQPLPGGAPPPSAAAEGGMMRLKLPELSSRGFTTNCLGQDDLSVSPAGEVALKTSAGATVMALQNPHRLLLVLDR